VKRIVKRSVYARSKLVVVEVEVWECPRCCGMLFKRELIFEPAKSVHACSKIGQKWFLLFVFRNLRAAPCVTFVSDLLAVSALFEPATHARARNLARVFVPKLV
jgi:hypothetical protein